ncbi:TVP38/TMEM64 family protein [Paenibacillus albiflavus]|uniref:TVP38/TMEM64 family membrane protein n=1 Tax=Paenibacillus albiflavus TaxID=2545760 RepID=A0A4R4E4U6_9BACL|nr:VTT domain-containing protein [Paenibacillus albiflavus]TCZ74634.1 TVP38/TMEM64 family protein [Paenibacillus albiflavus]
MSSWLELPPIISHDSLIYLLEKYKSFGPIPGILITFIESFIPPLPLFLLVAANSAAYGLWTGFICSWIGVVSGSICIYLFFRHLADHPIITKWKTNPFIINSLEWVQKHSFGSIFIISCLPMGPAFIVHIAAGISRMPILPFVLAITSGKAIMILIVSFIGRDFIAFIHNPIKLLILASFAASLWFASKLIEARLTR